MRARRLKRWKNFLSVNSVCRAQAFLRSLCSFYAHGHPKEIYQRRLTGARRVGEEESFLFDCMTGLQYLLHMLDLTSCSKYIVKSNKLV